MYRETKLNRPYAKDVAIIGMSCRFPGADNIDQFWQNLLDGKETISTFSDQELISSGLSKEEAQSPNYVKAKPLINNIDMFDASFFGICPREAEVMDPQHRLFLELTQQTIEQAGYNPSTYNGKIGIFGSKFINTYFLSLLLSDYAEIKGDLTKLIHSLYLRLVNEDDYFVNFIAYKLNLTGPAVTVATACSSSLVAVHLACQSLIRDECSMAMAGGVSLRIPQISGHYYRKGEIFSPDGCCRPFDSQANGTIFGDGLGIVMLKLLDDALEDKDHIWGVIQGSAINNDGSSKVGFTAPNVSGQAEVIRQALDKAGVQPPNISYIETHGTGTPIGDPIEFAALGEVFETATNRSKKISIGSVKANIGHLRGASGIAGLIKTVLILRNRIIPPQINYNLPNAALDITESAFIINKKKRPLLKTDSEIYAGVSSFGLGGTNSHIILKSPPPPINEGDSNKYNLFVLSAKTESALKKYKNNFVTYFSNDETGSARDICHTLQTGRKSLPKKLFHIYSSKEEIISFLSSQESVRSRCIQSGKDKSVAFLFPGQGAQHIGMAQYLYNEFKYFKEIFEECASLVEQATGQSLTSCLYSANLNCSQDVNNFHQSHYSQITLFVIEFALGRLLLRLGIEPEVMIGHSIGEFTAACIAKILSVADALQILLGRSKLLDKLSHGKMLAVALSVEGLRPFLDNNISLAAINSPTISVLSGPIDAITRLMEKLREQKIDFIDLETHYAFHSTMLDPIVHDFTGIVKKADLHPPCIPIISTVTGKLLTDEQALDPYYWTDVFRKPVMFSAAIQSLIKVSDEHIFLEIGPGNGLSALAKEHLQQDSGAIFLQTMPHRHGKSDEASCFLKAIGCLFLNDKEINWKEFYRADQAAKIPLPTYPFERKRFWAVPSKAI